MSAGAAQLALRETRGFLAQRGVIAGVVAVSLIMGLSGPFNTLVYLTLVPRIAYWTCIVAGSFALGSFISAYGERRFRTLPHWASFGLTVLATGTAVFGFVWGFNGLVMGWSLGSVGDLVWFWITVVAIATVVEGGIGYVAAGRQAATDRPALLERLPLDKRGTLIALSATDHYVNVITSAGSELVLIRLADAIAETGQAGLQVHRSHWVAKDQVTACRRSGDRAVLTMANGDEIPASRRYIPALREAGLLER